MHTMIDLETLDNSGTSCILSIGAIKFDPFSNKLGEELSLYVSNPNGTFSVDTFVWWLQQGEQARQALVNGIQGRGTSLSDALSSLMDFVKRDGLDGVWSNGASFDIPIIESAARRCKIDIPWKFYNIYDTRTVFLLKGKATLKREGIYHDALGDAIYQAKCIQEAITR